MAAALWSTSPSIPESTTSTSPSVVFLFQVSVSGLPTGESSRGLKSAVSVHVLGSPFSVPVRELVDPSKVRCFGPGLESGVRAQVPQTFTVDSSKAGPAPLVVRLYGPTGGTLGLMFC